MFGRFRRVAAALGAAGMLVVSMNTVPASAANPVEGPNLLVNPGAEFGDPSSTGYSAVSIPGWNMNGTPTVVKYGAIGRFPSPLSTPAPPFPKLLQFPRPGGGPDRHWHRALHAERMARGLPRRPVRSVRYRPIPRGEPVVPQRCQDRAG